MLNALQNTHNSGDIKTLCSKIYYFLPPIAGFNNIFFVYKKKLLGWMQRSMKKRIHLK